MALLHLQVVLCTGLCCVFGLEACARRVVGMRGNVCFENVHTTVMLHHISGQHLVPLHPSDLLRSLHLHMPTRRA